MNVLSKLLDKCQTLRSPKAIELHFLLDGDLWLECPSCFALYERHSTFYKDTLSSLLEEKNCYLDLGLDMLLAKTEGDIRELKSTREVTHQGFQPIRAATAAIILAKSLNLRFDGQKVYLADDVQYCPFIVPLNRVAEFMPGPLLSFFSLNLGIELLFESFSLILPKCSTKGSFDEDCLKPSYVLVGELDKALYFLNCF